MILHPYAQEGLILKRTGEEISRALGTFFVAEHDGSITGTVSYHDYGTRLKEVRSLAVKRESSGKGVGSRLVRHLVRALKAGVPGTKIFVLTYSPVFFQKLGFIEVPKESLPEKIWKDCDYCQYREDCRETALVYQDQPGDGSR